MAIATAPFIWALRAKLDDRLIGAAWAIAAIISALLGLLQYFGHSGILGHYLHVTAPGEAYANLRQRNQFATLMSIGLAAILWLQPLSQLLTFTTHSNRLVINMGPLTLVSTLALGNAMSGSRTGLLQWSFLLALSVLWSRKVGFSRVGLAGVAFVVYAIAATLAPLILESLTGVDRGSLLSRFTEEPGCGSRRVLWSNVWYLISQKPWMGWGWGELDYAHFVTMYPGERFCEILDNAHNLPLHLAVELGLPAACGLLGLFTLWFVRNRPWAEQNPTRQMAWAVLAVIGLHSMLEYPLWYGPFQLAVGLCVHLLWQTRPSAALQHTESEQKRKSLLDLPAATWLVSGLLLSVLSAAAWDYWRVSQLYKLPAERVAAYKDNAMEKVRDSRFFQDQVQFAELTTVSLERSNAAQHYAQAQRLLHFSPEPRVVEAAIESAVMLGRDDEALYYLQRYKAAFPADHAKWVARSARFKTP